MPGTGRDAVVGSGRTSVEVKAVATPVGRRTVLELIARGRRRGLPRVATIPHRPARRAWPHQKRGAMPTDREQAEADTANQSGRQPVVFVHGLWLLPSSWDAWRARFEEQGYATLAPGWPDDPDTVEQARANPEVFAGKSVGQVADHYAEVIGHPAAQARHRRPFLRRAAHPDARRPRARCRLGGDRPGAVPGRAAPTAVGAEVLVPGAAQPTQPQARRWPDVRPVPLRLRQRGVGGGSAPAVRHLLRRRSGSAALPSGDGEPQPMDRRQRGHEEPRPRTAPDHLRARRTTRCRGASPTPRSSASRSTRRA